MTEAAEHAPSGAEVITQFLRHSPFVPHLGMRLVDVSDADGRLVAKGIVTYKLG